MTHETENNETENNEAIRLTADTVLIAPDAAGLDHVLLICRRWDPHEGQWALPGGHVDAGEDAADAAVRELAEETGIQARVREIVEVGAWHTPGRDPRGRYVTVAYRTELPAIIAPTADDDAASAQWIPVDALDDHPLAFDHRRIITAALASRYPRRQHTAGTVGIQADTVTGSTVIQRRN